MVLAVRGHIAKRPKRRKRKKAKSVKVYRPRLKQTALARKRRANAQLDGNGPSAQPLGCQHPKSRARGVCQMRAITVKVNGERTATEFTIPATYKPETRHVGQPPLPNPARLCPQHKFLIDAHAEALESGAKDDLSRREGGTGRPADFAHRSQCPVCARITLDPNLQRTIDRWARWELTTTAAAIEMDVTVASFNHHMQYYSIDKRKADKVNREKVITDIIESGLRSGKASAKDAIAGVRELGRLRGDVADNVNVQAAVVDMSSVATADLIKRNAELLKRLAELESGSP